MRVRPALSAAIYLAALALSSHIYANDSEVSAKHAIATFEQRNPDLSLLLKAAETGDNEAQFYLAETLSLLSGHITPEAYAWYERSANQGDIYSMYRLSRINHDLCTIIGNCPSQSASPKTWADTLLETVQKRALEGDGEGMEMMYTITGDLNWLVKSAVAGYPSAQNWLAIRYEWGDGWFFWPGQRKKEIERLYKASAEGGYPRAIGHYAGLLLLEGDVEEAQKWLMKGVSIGYVPAVATYATVLKEGEHYNFDIDLQYAYALNLALSEIGGGAKDTSNYVLEKLKTQLTSEQIKEATHQAKEWKKAHPPVSYYPPKLERW